jgi:hypothetical protein
VIMGIAVVALVAALGTAALTSDLSARNGTAQALLRSAAETVKAEPYVACATTYNAAPGPLPAGYSIAVVGVDYGTISGGTATYSSTCPPDAGAQRVTIRVTSGDGRVQRSVQIVKRP